MNQPPDDPETCTDCGYDLEHGHCPHCIREQNFVVAREDEVLRAIERAVDGKETV